MDIVTSCTHTHHVGISLTEDERWTVQPPSWQGDRPVLVTRLSAAVSPEGKVERVRASGYYKKKDGTAGKAQTGSYGIMVKLADLPLPIGTALVEAAANIEHSKAGAS